MSAVDVLAVMDAAIQPCGCASPECSTNLEAERMREARAAVEKLIADRAELLEALQRLEEAADDSDSACYGTLSTSVVRDIARAAIARATGAGHD